MSESRVSRIDKVKNLKQNKIIWNKSEQLNLMSEINEKFEN